MPNVILGRRRLGKPDCVGGNWCSEQDEE